MALGGGTFTTQNKRLPGTYTNFSSVQVANSSLSDRGIATMPLELDWGIDGEIFEVSESDFEKYALRIFGYEHTHDRMKKLRDLFKGGTKLLKAYKLNSGGTKAGNSFGTAIYSGVRGNNLGIAVQTNLDNEELFDVITYFDSIKVDAQTVKAAAELTDNAYFIFDKSVELSATALTKCTGGANAAVDGASHQAYIEQAEFHGYNTMGVETTDQNVKALYTAFVKRMRAERGSMFQLVLYNHLADDIAVISVKNKALDNMLVSGSSIEYPNEAALVYWVTGAECSCAVNASVQNRKYDGEFDIEYTKNGLEESLNHGEFVFHKNNADICVLSDINTLVTTTKECGEVFKDNQTIRVIDQLANDDAVLFNTNYLGKCPNNNAGRISLQTDLISLRKKLNDIGAIENFDSSDLTIEQGETKKAVVVTCAITVVNAMDKLYITTTVA